MHIAATIQIVKGYNVGWFKWSVFSYFKIIIFCFVVPIFDLVHDGEAIHYL